MRSATEKSGMALERAFPQELARGVVLVLFGALALTIPGGFLTLVLRMFGMVALLDGVLAFAGLFRQRGTAGPAEWTLAMEGISGVGAGLLTILWPALTAFVLLTIVGIWAFLTGAAELFPALGEPASPIYKAFRLLRAVLGVAFGVLLLAHPVVTSATMIIVVGCYAISMGAAQIMTALVTRRLPLGSRKKP
jgi:uncharacterized membrane protein HdeD (DUF308 family)